MRVLKCSPHKIKAVGALRARALKQGWLAPGLIRREKVKRSRSILQINIYLISMLDSKKLKPEIDIPFQP